MTVAILLLACVACLFASTARAEGEGGEILSTDPSATEASTASVESTSPAVAATSTVSSAPVPIDPVPVEEAPAAAESDEPAAIAGGGSTSASSVPVDVSSNSTSETIPIDLEDSGSIPQKAIALPPPPAPVAHAVSEIAAKVDRDAESIVQGAGPTVSGIVGEASGVVGRGSRLLPMDLSQILAPIAEAPAGVETAGPFSSPFATSAPSMPLPPFARAVVAGGSLQQYLGERGAIVIPGPAAQTGIDGDGAGGPPRSQADAPRPPDFVDGFGKHLVEHAPLDGKGPVPLPESPQPTAVGAVGSSSFVPIAALLALLALVAPAIFRRLRKVADLSPPLPFVCALERPG